MEVNLPYFSQDKCCYIESHNSFYGGKKSDINFIYHDELKAVCRFEPLRMLKTLIAISALTYKVRVTKRKYLFFNYLYNWYSYYSDSEDRIIRT